MNMQMGSKVIFVMGVSGSGKTSVGQLLANHLEISFIDADDHHPEANIEKMSNGIPLTDSDREPWLERLREIAIDHMNSGCVIACSALKKEYRVRLTHSIESQSIWIYLKGTYDQIFERMKARSGHFMDAKMLKSQFEALEEPIGAVEMNIVDSPEVIVKKIKMVLSMKAEVGVIGMGVMGRSLSRNLARNGFKVALFNRHVDGSEENVAVDFQSSYPELSDALPHDNLEHFIDALETPRKIILMVNAGAAVDAVLGQLQNNLQEGDIVIDGGNSHFNETNRRIDAMKKGGYYFIGAGVSGGEQGALTGPSIMPSGDQEAYAKIQKYLEAIAAKDENQKPCCTYVGRQGSGHFVKMIHNGIEYAEMQLLAECYSILKDQGMSNENMADVFESWMEDLGSYLLGITVDILRKKEGEGYLIDHILDRAGNKGTGKWATSSIADSGEPATMIPAALFARYLSFFKEKRGKASVQFPKEGKANNVTVSELKKAYQFGRIINHHQGFSLISRVSDQHDWKVNLSEIARIWTEGCIIKSDFMKKLVEVLKGDESILFNQEFNAVVKESHAAIQSVAMECIRRQIHIPCLLESANFFHGLTTADCSANLIQAQRDYFGAHTYQRKEDPSGRNYHTEW